jgi:hypothetical protein
MDKRDDKRVPYQKPTLEEHEVWVSMTGLSTGGRLSEFDSEGE